MRNLKKILALVLALVMSLSLVTIANASDFTDSDDITYAEAADVMSTIGIIEGFEDGSFDPDGTLTREQAATLVTRMLLGDNADRLGIESSTFNDVAVTRWSAPYIEYCVSLGLIDGAGDGNFYPAGQLTGYAFAKILLTALGYDSEKEGLVGTSWSVNTAALAMEVGLDDGLENGISNAVLSREEAAQMALNAIKAPLVAYENDVTIVVGDTPVSFGSGDAYYITTTLAREQRISDRQLSNSNDYTVEFGERYFPNLRLVSETDAFERPSHTWVYENEELGTYVDYETRVGYYTAGVEYGELYDLIGRTVLDNYDLYAYVDGVDSTEVANANGDKFDFDDVKRNNDDTATNTGRGVLTEVFVNHDEETVTITSINTYLTFAAADYNTSREYLTVDIYSYDDTNNQLNIGRTANVRLYAEDFPEVEDYAEGDALLVTIADGDVQTIADPEFIEDAKITRFSQTKGDDDVAGGRVTKITTGGEPYSNNVTSQWDEDVLDQYNDDRLVDATYDIYLDQYGYFIGVGVHELALQYVFVTAIDYVNSNRANATATASAIFADTAEMTEITIDVKRTNDKIEEAEFDSRDTDGNGIIDGSESSTADLTGIYEIIDSDSTDPDDATKPGAWWNTWYSYTMRGDKYVLTPVANQGWQRSNTDEAEINSAWTTLKNGSSVSGRTTAYGNANSVYITVDTTTVDINNDEVYTVDRVTSSTTGVKNVDLVVPARTADNEETTGVYFIYDGDQYVIAAIVVGDDNNLTKDFAYVIDGYANYEDYDDEYNYWAYDAIVDGVLVDDLTEQGDWSNLNKSENNPGMFRVWYNSDGYVVEAERVTGKDYTVRRTQDIVRGETAIYERLGITDAAGAAELFQKGDTLWIVENRGNGLVMADDCAFVVIDQHDDVDDSISNLASALAMADKDNDTSNGIDFAGSIVAELNDRGEAQVLILDCSIDPLPDDDDVDADVSYDIDAIDVSLNDGKVSIDLTVSEITNKWTLNNYKVTTVISGEGDEITRTNTTGVTVGNDGVISYDLRNLSLTSGGDYTIEVTVTFDGDEDSNTYKLTGSEDFTIR